MPKFMKNPSFLYSRFDRIASTRSKWIINLKKCTFPAGAMKSYHVSVKMNFAMSFFSFSRVFEAPLNACWLCFWWFYDFFSVYSVSRLSNIVAGISRNRWHGFAVCWLDFIFIAMKVMYGCTWFREKEYQIKLNISVFSNKQITINFAIYS